MPTLRYIKGFGDLTLFIIHPKFAGVSVISQIRCATPLKFCLFCQKNVTLPREQKPMKKAKLPH